MAWEGEPLNDTPPRHVPISLQDCKIYNSSGREPVLGFHPVDPDQARSSFDIV